MNLAVPFWQKLTFYMLQPG